MARRGSKKSAMKGRGSKGGVRTTMNNAMRVMKGRGGSRR